MPTVSEYIIQRLEQEGLKHLFLLPGGGCMYLVDAVARSTKLKGIPMLHEQSVGIAAEAYAQYSNKLSTALVTTGPGATNAITPCAAAWTDSTPVLFISGQVKTADTASKYGVRQKGFQEIPITEIVKPITKKAVRLDDPSETANIVEELIQLATSGRPGPVWLDIPLDIQAMECPAENNLKPLEDIKPRIDAQLISEIVEKLSTSKRPMILAGNGVRLSGATEELVQLARKIDTPMLLTWKALDFLDENDELNAGRPGAIAQRWSNFAQQNSDFLLVIGARLDLGQIAYRDDMFARGASVFYVDIDNKELSKFESNHIRGIHADSLDFILALMKQIDFSNESFDHSEWKEQIHNWKKSFPIIQEKHLNPKNGANVYVLLEKIANVLTPNDIFVPGSSGACSEVAMQSFRVKRGQRVLNSEALGPMGFGIAAPIGACLASGGKRTLGLDGDGGFLMNVQELATLKYLNLPIKIFVLNNNGYGSIKNSQDNYFEGRRLGTDPKSGLGLPNIEKMVRGFELDYFQIASNSEIDEVLSRVMPIESPTIIEVIVDQNQMTEPRTTTTKLANGKLVTMPMEDLAPKLDRETLEEIMYIRLAE